MSLLTTLAYAITAAVRPRVRDAEIAALQAKVDDLRRQFDETLTRVERQRDDWQALAMQYRDALFQRPAPQRHFIDEEMRLRMQAQERMNQAAAQQLAFQPYQMAQQTNAQNAQAHQLSMMQNGPYIGQQLGVQLDEYVRNCTPGRHELLTSATSRL